MLKSWRMQRAATARGLRGWLRGRRGGVVCALACAAALLWAACGRGAGAGGGGVQLSARLEFPRRSPLALAHMLADFSTLPHLAPHNPDPGSWRVEEESGNYTSWRYHVSWTCGAQCTGRARVAAHAYPPHPAAPPAAHRVTLHLRLCADTKASCDEMEILADVESDGEGGSVLREHARALCVQHADTCAARLRTHRAHHHDTLARP